MTHSRIRHYFRHGTLPQFVVFEASARLLSFTRAAEELHMAQSTVSVQIRKLSATIGVPLFEQIGRQVFLTEPGKRLYRHCENLFAGLNALEDEMSALRDMRTGRLRLAAGTIGKYFAPRMLAGFLQEYPGVEAALAIHNRCGLLDRLARNEDELYLFANPPEDRDIVRQSILANPMVVFAPAHHPLVNEHAIPMEQLAREPLLMRETGSGTRGVVDEIFARQGITPRVRMEFTTNEAIKQAILAGLGVSILSRYTLGVDTDHRQLATLDVEGFPLERHWYFAYPAGRELSPVATSFLGYVHNRVQPHLMDALRA